MTEKQSHRRLAENEVFFRQKNRSIETQFASINKLAKDSNQSDFIDSDDMILSFYCECSDETCELRVPLRRNDYDKIHSNNDTFIVVPGHEVTEIESIVTKTDVYYEVRKNFQPPTSSSTLNATSLNNK